MQFYSCKWGHFQGKCLQVILNGCMNLKFWHSDILADSRRILSFLPKEFSLEVGWNVDMYPICAVPPSLPLLPLSPSRPPPPPPSNDRRQVSAHNVVMPPVSLNLGTIIRLFLFVFFNWPMTCDKIHKVGSMSGLLWTTLFHHEKCIETDSPGEVAKTPSLDSTFELYLQHCWNSLSIPDCPASLPASSSSPIRLRRGHHT